jgi:hypothetical protein
VARLNSSAHEPFDANCGNGVDTFLQPISGRDTTKIMFCWHFRQVADMFPIPPHGGSPVHPNGREVCLTEQSYIGDRA